MRRRWSASSARTPAGEGVEQLLAAASTRWTASQSALVFDAGGYASFFDRLAFEAAAPSPRRAHPRLKILGLLEARLLDADLVLLAGLDETIWPPQAESGAFLNRSMRLQLGLSPPERRIGQTAHDFSMAFGASEVVLSRARKRDGAPTVVSRLVARLAALAGDAFLACKARGDETCALAAALDRPPRCAPSRGRCRARRSSCARAAQRHARREAAARSLFRLRRADSAPRRRCRRSARRRACARSASPFMRRWRNSTRRIRKARCRRMRARVSSLWRARSSTTFLDDPSFLAFDWPRLEAGLDHALAFERERRERGARDLRRECAANGA